MALNTTMAAINSTLAAATEISNAFDATIEADDPKFGKPQFSSHTWVEPLIVVSIMLASLYFNRLRSFKVVVDKKERPGLLESESSTDNLLPHEVDINMDDEDYEKYTTPISTSMSRPGKQRSCFGLPIRTPNSSRFANNYHSRFIQKFPFLVEMFYWILNYGFYAVTKPITAQWLMSPETVWQRAQDHGIAILNFEHESWARYLFFKEVDFQQWFIGNHLSALTFLNRAYSLVHIPGTVACIAWYYHAAPSHAHFATFRRSLTLLNFSAFLIFTVYPCMPPRLLPSEYGFVDTVHRENAESIWVEGKFTNKLAAMPSLHFGYSFCVGMTFIYHSGIFRRRNTSIESNEPLLSRFWQFIYILAGIAYPTFLLTVIVATANHYLMDALIASLVLLAAYFCNRIWLFLLPLEDMFLWVLRLEKPVPTTGMARRQKRLASKSGVEDYRASA